MAKIVEVKTVKSDGEANKLLEEGWELYAALDPIKGEPEKYPGYQTASYVLVKHDEPSRKMVSF